MNAKNRPTTNQTSEFRQRANNESVSKTSKVIGGVALVAALAAGATLVTDKFIGMLPNSTTATEQQGLTRSQDRTPANGTETAPTPSPMDVLQAQDGTQQPYTHDTFNPGTEIIDINTAFMDHPKVIGKVGDFNPTSPLSVNGGVSLVEPGHNVLTFTYGTALVAIDKAKFPPSSSVIDAQHPFVTIQVDPTSGKVTAPELGPDNAFFTSAVIGDAVRMTSPTP